ncbi:transposase [Streptomyces sp. JL2001]|uniref:transposase n=1 Tax=unclassified Streptomyces TaxID=2593676 RepID=UPI0036948E99
MTDAEWTAVRPLLPVPAGFQGPGRRPKGYRHRQLHAIRSLVAGGITWRARPADLPARARVYAFFRRRREHGLIAQFHDRPRGTLRERKGREGREAEPTAGIIDAQSVRAATTGPAVSRGDHGRKKAPSHQCGARRLSVLGCVGKGGMGEALVVGRPSPEPPPVSSAVQ